MVAKRNLKVENNCSIRSSAILCKHIEIYDNLVFPANHVIKN